MDSYIRNKEKITRTKTSSTHKEYSTPKKMPNFSNILPQASNFYVCFPKNNVEEENYDDDFENEENNSKIKLRKYSIKKIFNMQRIPYKNISPYVVFTFSYVQSETVTNTITTFKIDYKNVMKMVDTFYIQFGDEEEDIGIKKKSMDKIFNLLGLPINKRLSLMQFYEVDEDVVYEEEEEEDEEEDGKYKSGKKKSKNGSNYSGSYSKNQTEMFRSIETTSNTMKSSLNKSLKAYLTPNKPKKTNKIRIVNTGTTPYTSDKLEKSSFEQLLNLVNNMTTVLKKIKKNKKGNKKDNKKLLIEGNVQKYHGKNIDSTILTLKSLEERIIYMDKPIYKYKLKARPVKREEPHQKKTVALRVRSRTTQMPPNICVYPFILRKRAEYGDRTMYLVGSLPQLGNFNPKMAIPMNEENRNNQIFYTKYINIKREEFPFEYKYFYIKDNEIIWVGMPFKNYKTHPQFFKLFHTIKKSIISILDLNIRYLNDVDLLNVWDYRKEAFIQCLLNSYADVFFFQEITHEQYDYIDENLNSVYEFVGIYRDSTDKSEKCSISYNIFKYTLTDWGQFWLSSTPNVAGSNDFNNFFPRICTWAALKQINGIDLMFFNIHLDHVNFSAHLPCINVYLEESEKILERFPQVELVIFGGCLYCEEDDIVIQRIKSYGYEEVMFENTFHDFTGEADRHWDYLFWKERNYTKNIELKRAFVPKRDAKISEERKQYISDHYPCYAEFQQKTQRNMNNLRIVSDDKYN